MERGEAHISARPAPLQRTIAETANLDPCVHRVWLLEGTQPLGTRESPHAADLRIHAVILILDSRVVGPDGADYQEVASRYRHAFQTLVEEGDEVLVLTYYTTEPLPGWLHGYPELPLKDIAAAAPPAGLAEPQHHSTG
jgi:hypothetical protein